ncbi:MaoC family dehydratase [Streptomyces mayteni]
MPDAPDVPGLPASYARALLPKRPARAGAVPRRVLTVDAAAPDPRRLARYAELCGHPPESGPPPAGYPHLLAFPAALALLTRRDFPFPALGLVHLANRIERTRPLGADEPLALRVEATAARPHRRGTAFDVVAEATPAAGGAPVWRSFSTYLHRDRPDTPRPPRRPEEPRPGPVLAEFAVPAATGRRYAAVSGDRNPIHLHSLTARLLGFRRAIAHGMWTKARCLAALDHAEPLPDAFTVDVTFHAPVPLPSRVELRAWPRDEGRAFELRAAGAGPVHLRGHLHG